jgi:O-acetylhomoserine/O-acetylserine sulfhydrylase-like pyridoxal-dependent enzyme
MMETKSLAGWNKTISFPCQTRKPNVDIGTTPSDHQPYYIEYTQEILTLKVSRELSCLINLASWLK